MIPARKKKIKRKRKVSEMRIETDRIKDCPYKGLAAGIVNQAVNDYRKLLVRWRKYPKYRRRPSERQKLAELEEFFRSDWYQILCTVDGELVMQKIKNSV